MRQSQFIPLLISIFLLLFLDGCASGPSAPASPKTGSSVSTGGGYKVGQPYQIGGTWYYPHEDFSYDETGIASWYGADFHGQRTANGEMYNMEELTAAHKTLPLPSLARVTNLENGRSIVVRINDRGPFSGARIIDVSQRAAQLLGFEQTGTAKVRVQVLADESKAIADAMRRYGSSAPTQLASAETAVSGSSEPPANLTPAPLAGGVEVKTLDPIRTTPAVHKELLSTVPVAQVVQLPITGSHPISVQAGAFTVAANAQKLQQNLARFGKTTITQSIVNGTTFYRVRLPVADVASADAMLGNLKRAGVIGARTVVD